MKTDATIGRVSRPRGVLSDEQQQRVGRATIAKARADREYAEVILSLLAEGCSFSEVSKATGLSTNTLQRWKREAGK